MRWQSDKIKYMEELKQYVNIPKTIIVPQHSDVPDLEELMENLGCEEIVMKPAHGNGGYGVKDITRENMNERYEKFRAMGKFDESAPSPSSSDREEPHS